MCNFLYNFCFYTVTLSLCQQLLGERSEPHMGDTSGIFHILLLLYIYYRTYVGVCVTPFFFFFGVRCAQYKVHAQCSFAALVIYHCAVCILFQLQVRRHSSNIIIIIQAICKVCIRHML